MDSQHVDLRAEEFRKAKALIAKLQDENRRLNAQLQQATKTLDGNPETVVRIVVDPAFTGLAKRLSWAVAVYFWATVIVSILLAVIVSHA